jgi:hypothetical protein
VAAAANVNDDENPQVIANEVRISGPRGSSGSPRNRGTSRSRSNSGISGSHSNRGTSGPHESPRNSGSRSNRGTSGSYKDDGTIRELKEHKIKVGHQILFTNIPDDLTVDKDYIFMGLDKTFEKVYVSQYESFLADDKELVSEIRSFDAALVENNIEIGEFRGIDVNGIETPCIVLNKTQVYVIPPKNSYIYSEEHIQEIGDIVTVSEHKKRELEKFISEYKVGTGVTIDGTGEKCIYLGMRDVNGLQKYALFHAAASKLRRVTLVNREEIPFTADGTYYGCKVRLIRPIGKTPIGHELQCRYIVFFNVESKYNIYHAYKIDGVGTPLYNKDLFVELEKKFFEFIPLKSHDDQNGVEYISPSVLLENDTDYKECNNELERKLNEDLGPNPTNLLKKIGPKTKKDVRNDELGKRADLAQTFLNAIRQVDVTCQRQQNPLVIFCSILFLFQSAANLSAKTLCFFTGSPIFEEFKGFNIVDNTETKRVATLYELFLSFKAKHRNAPLQNIVYFPILHVKEFNTSFRTYINTAMDYMMNRTDASFESFYAFYEKLKDVKKQFRPLQILQELYFKNRFRFLNWLRDDYLSDENVQLHFSVVFTRKYDKEGKPLNEHTYIGKKTDDELNDPDGLLQYLSGFFLFQHSIAVANATMPYKEGFLYANEMRKITTQFRKDFIALLSHGDRFGSMKNKTGPKKNTTMKEGEEGVKQPKQKGTLKNKDKKEITQEEYDAAIKAVKDGEDKVFTTNQELQAANKSVNDLERELHTLMKAKQGKNTILGRFNSPINDLRKQLRKASESHAAELRKQIKEIQNKLDENPIYRKADQEFEELIIQEEPLEKKIEQASERQKAAENANDEAIEYLKQAKDLERKFKKYNIIVVPRQEEQIVDKRVAETIPDKQEEVIELEQDIVGQGSNLVVESLTAAEKEAFIAPPSPPPPVTDKTKEKLSQTAIVTTGNLAEKLKKVCLKSSFCLALGVNREKIESLFDFMSLKHLKDHVVDLSVVGNNGKIKLLNFSVQIKGINTYDAKALLKMAKIDREWGRIQKAYDKSKRDYSNPPKITNIYRQQYISKNTDSLFYEYLVGMFINTYTDKYPLFVRTYGIFKFKTLETLDYCNVGDIRDRIPPKKFIESVEPFNVPDLETLIKNDGNPVKLNEDSVIRDALLIEHIDDKPMQLGEFLLSLCQKYVKSPDEWTVRALKYEVLYIFCQVYFTLADMYDVFTHYDLHQGNVLIYQLDHAVEFCYHDEDEKVYTFKSKYLVKVIDYGRCYFKYSEKVSSGEFYDKVLCKLSPKEGGYCGHRYGFHNFTLGPTAKNFYIDSGRRNQSHDLKLAYVIKTYYLEPSYRHDTQNIQSAILPKESIAFLTKEASWVSGFLNKVYYDANESLKNAQAEGNPDRYKRVYGCEEDAQDNFGHFYNKPIRNVRHAKMLLKDLLNEHGKDDTYFSDLVLDRLDYGPRMKMKFTPVKGNHQGETI